MPFCSIFLMILLYYISISNSSEILHTVNRKIPNFSAERINLLQKDSEQQNLGRDYVEEIAQGGSANDPAIHFRINKHGVALLREIVNRLFEQSIENLHIYNVSIEAKSAKFSLQNFKVAGLSSAPADHFDLELIDPNELRMKMYYENIQIKGDVKVSALLGARSEGSVLIAADHLNITLALKMTRDGGYPYFSLSECDPIVESLEAVRRDFTNLLLKPVIRAFNVYAQKSKPIIYEYFCTKLNQLIEINMNSMIQNYPLHMFLTGLPQNDYYYREEDYINQFTDDEETEEEDRFFENLAKLSIDLSLVDDPFISTRAIDLKISGKVTRRTDEFTPFNSAYFQDFNESESRMAYIAVTDFVLNSMFYHLFKQGLLKTKLIVKHVRDYHAIFGHLCFHEQNQTCSPSLIKEIWQTYPNYLVVIHTEVTRAPAIIFRQNKLIISLEALVTVHVMDRNKNSIKVLTVSLEAEPEGLLFVKNDAKVVGSVKVPNDKITTKLISSVIHQGMDQVKIDTFKQQWSAMIENLFNRFFNEGFTLPQFSFGRLANVQLSINERQIQLSSDIEIDTNEFVSVIFQ